MSEDYRFRLTPVDPDPCAVITTEAQAAVPDLHYIRHDPDPLDCDHGATFTGPGVITFGGQVVSEPFTSTYCYVCHHLAPTLQEDPQP